VPIANGAAGIRQTTKAMARIVAQYEQNPYIQAFAIDLVQLHAPKDSPAEIRSLFEFVQQNIRYVGDVIGKETVRTPDITIAMRAGDCDDKAVLLASLLRAIEYPAAFIVTGYRSPYVFEHVYIGILESDGGYLALDPTENQPLGWEPPNPIAFYIERIP
jgi:transglutaminase-like putative cysteine protease